MILGRSGFEVLRGYADVFHVRVQAPFSIRVGRVMEQQNLTFEEAEEMVKSKEKVRLAFVDEFYNVPGDRSRPFDLIVNTEKVSPNLATSWVIRRSERLHGWTGN